jgi:outer membrane protein TolC
MGVLPYTRLRAAPVSAAIALVGLAGAQARADEPLTLAQALVEAHTANARLPVPAMDVDIAREHIREARAELWLKVSVDGDIIYAPSSGYDGAVSNLGEVRLQLVGQQPLLDGGGKKAALARARAGVVAAGARYRIAEKDLDLEVRSRMAEFVSAESEVQVRREGRERLKRYLSSLESRQASGQGIEADLLKTRVREATEEADLADALQREDEARLGLNDLLGRDPEGPLLVAALPGPEPPPPPEAEAWLHAPELAAAAADADSAAAALKVTRSERSLHLSAGADAGLWGADTASSGLFSRLKHDWGYSLSLNFTWPVFDLGSYRARVAAASLELRQAQQTQEVERRRVRLEWHKAHQSLVNAYRQIAILSGAVPMARDSSLASESRYRGGASSALDVLDAHAASVDAAVRLGDAMMRYRIAQALEIRWGSQ